MMMYRNTTLYLAAFMAVLATSMVPAADAAKKPRQRMMAAAPLQQQPTTTTTAETRPDAVTEEVEVPPPRDEKLASSASKQEVTVTPQTQTYQVECGVNPLDDSQYAYCAKDDVLQVPGARGATPSTIEITVSCLTDVKNEAARGKRRNVLSKTQATQYEPEADLKAQPRCVTCQPLALTSKASAKAKAKKGQASASYECSNRCHTSREVHVAGIYCDAPSTIQRVK